MTDKVKEDPRVAMKIVRADVKDIVLNGPWTGMNNLGDYPKGMAEARRTIIALQDMLDTSISKHEQATVHVMELKHTQEVLNNNNILMSISFIHALSEKDTTISALKATIKSQSEAVKIEREYSQTINMDNEILGEALYKSDEKLAAAMMTIKTALED